MKKVINVFSKIILIFLFICAVAVTVLKVQGFIPYSILTDSMSPQYPPNSLIFVKVIPFEELKLNDVITFVTEDTDKPVTHRIIEIDNEEKIVFTKGDNNEFKDIEPTFSENIIGKVYFKIPFLGKLSYSLSNLFN